MSSNNEKGFISLSNLKLWFKLKSKTSLNLSDFSEIIPLRWNFFRDDWEFIKNGLIEKIPNYNNPDKLNHQIDTLSRFISIQRNNPNKSSNPFSNGKVFTRYYAVWDNIPINIIPLTKVESGIINNKISQVNQYTRADFIEIRKNLASARDTVADTVGLSDDLYNQSFDRRSSNKLRQSKLSDVSHMQIFNSAILECDNVLSNLFRFNIGNIDPFALAKSNANNPDVTIKTGNSGFFVKMEYGESMQSLAARYLGDSDRWIEIAIANGLKAPYVDEVGTFIKLLSNASNSSINISRIDSFGMDLIELLYIGQPVFLSSDSYKFPEQREIVDIYPVPISNEIVIEISGENDLDRYKTADNAGFRVYSPNTINSNFMIMIPSEESLDEVNRSRVPFFLQSKKEDERKAGVDLLLNDDMDLNLIPSSDVQLSYGLLNAVQAVKLKVISEQGQLFRHPNFGLPAIQGEKSSNKDLVRQQLVNSINKQIESDSRFQRVESLSVSLSNVAETKSFIVQLVVRMAGTGSLVPISFSVKAG
jgi:hypothetical protein